MANSIYQGKLMRQLTIKCYTFVSATGLQFVTWGGAV